MRGNHAGLAFDTGKPIVALDIDGTLGDYHGHFLRFAEGWYGREMPDPSQINPGLPLHQFMGTSKAKYRECKLAYRQGGLKRNMPAYPGAAELTRFIRGQLKAEVWICTTRPFLRLDNIDPDTRHWLRRNGIQYDGVIWGENKYRDLAKRVGVERIAAVLEDLQALADQAKGIGIPNVYLRDQPYNKWVDSRGRHNSKALARGGITRVYDLESPMLLAGLEVDVHNWYGERGK